MRLFFVFDVESMGLHGEPFAVGGGVYAENGAAQSEFRFCIEPGAAAHVEDAKWVGENVPQMEITHRSGMTMRAAFWAKWLLAKEQGAVMAAEVPWPVEGRFLNHCIRDNYTGRKMDGPYPLYDIASIMFAAGMDPMDSYPRTESEKPAHDPLADARQSARLLAEALAKLNH